MKTQNVSRTVLAAGVGAVLAATALLYVPEFVGQGPPPPPGPAERATIAAHAGAQAALPDLAALITDREKWLRDHPEDDASWAALGAAYTERGTRIGDVRDYPRAERALKRSLAERPAARGNVDAQLGLGALAGARGDWKSAKEWGERVRKAEPGRWPAYPVLIDAYNGLGDYEAARKAAEKLEELHAGAVVRARAAQAYRNRGWREDADAAALDAAALAETDAEKAASLGRLGDLAWERGEAAEALARYGSALRLVRDHGPSLAGRARALAGLGRTDEALRDWRAALARLPLPEYLLEAGELYEAVGLEGEARALYERLRSGTWVRGEVALGLLEADHGTPEAAVTRLRAEWARGHRSVAVADALGWALYRAGEPKEALGYAKRATDEGLRSALFTYHLGEIERALEQTGPARRHLAEALRINPEFSPLHARRAEQALTALGELPDELPKELRPEPPAQSAKAEGPKAEGPKAEEAAGPREAAEGATAADGGGDAKAPGTAGAPGTAEVAGSAAAGPGPAASGAARE
ncbi:MULTISPECIES: tetratricopeptide repeat protein [Streptomyces]|uniref:tetratricopeptide repeat protein n=1 Tax=Streptomyces TaxID=1883 RepID=UPI001CC22CE8|nr:tetratricopeptide repeat protein [Streptomyces venezuelae]